MPLITLVPPPFKDLASCGEMSKAICAWPVSRTQSFWVARVSGWTFWMTILSHFGLGPT